MYSGLRAHGSLGKASSPQCGSGGLSCCATGVIQAGNFFAAGFFCLIVLARRSPFAVSPRSAIKWPPSTRAKLKSILTFAFSALQSMKILFSCEDFSQKSFASLINRARARRRARAREAIKPYLFSLWMVGITAKRTAIHRTRRRQEGEDFGELLSRAAPAEPPLNGLKAGSPGGSPYPSPGEEMSHEAHLRKAGGRPSRRNEADRELFRIKTLERFCEHR